MALDHYYADLAPLLGNIIIEHGTLEGCAGRMLARLNGRGDDFSANQYAAKKTFNEKIKLARSLVEQNVVDAKIKTEFYAVFETMDRLNKARNKYIHAEYLPEVDGHDRVVGFFYRQIKQMGDTIDIDDPESDAPNPRLDEHELLKLIDDMVALGRDICVVSETYFDSLPYKLPEPP